MQKAAADEDKASARSLCHTDSAHCAVPPAQYHSPIFENIDMKWPAYHRMQEKKEWRS